MSEQDPSQLYRLYREEVPRLKSPYIPGDPDGMFDAFYRSPLFHFALVDQYTDPSFYPICHHEAGLQIASTKVGADMWEMLSNAALRQRLPRRCRMVMDQRNVRDFTNDKLAKDKNGRPVRNYSIPDSYVFDVEDPLPIVALGEATGLSNDRASETNPKESYYQKKLRWRSRHVGAEAVHEDAPCIFIVKQDAIVPTATALGEPTAVIDLATEFACLEDYVACPSRRRNNKQRLDSPKAVFAHMPLTGEQFRSKLEATEEIQVLLETVASLGRSSRARIANIIQMRCDYLEMLYETKTNRQPASNRPPWLDVKFG